MRTRTFLRLVTAGVVVCAALTLPASSSVAAGGCAGAGRMPTSTNGAQIRSAMLCLINVERRSHGLGALSASGELRKAAERYSRQMVREQFFDHVCPAGSTLTSRVRGSTSYLGGARSWSLGENIAWGSGSYATPKHTVSSWMKSAPHRHNILDGGFRHVGIGVAIGAPRNTRGRAAATYTNDFGYRG